VCVCVDFACVVHTALDAFGIHGPGGVLGGILTGPVVA
jgi:hypothetical protein